MTGPIVSPERPARGRICLLARRAALRVGGGVLVLFAAATLTFAALHLTPGDPVTAILGGPSADPTPETIAAARREYGLDRPLPVQYGLYIARLAQGNLGQSFSQHMPVLAVLRTQAPPTLELMLAALALAWILALASVLLTARRGPAGAVASVIETIGAGLPQFWLGILLLWALAFELRLFPPAGNAGPLSLVLPALSLAIPLGGFIAQVTRESFDLALDQPFILSARARGLGDRAVRLRHALRHALLPGISLSAWAIGALVGNAVPIETIFSRKGLGRELFLAVATHDMPLVTGIVLFIAVIYILAGLAADTLYVLVDPRMKAPRS
ncbi:ABC transporter permease [Gluconacetobacter tumulisoli]|uniref:ABC transporter permease n=1 Tax=Gluconacetobacter tumulisoli TaxID=1286189 RepID=A0A7W4K606_9PROT|nr:ABC transporter permease [Gluconacetobacter tumulisoli]MBB2200928.1 ABC transporter permease [Gluconacetobacter tumulisoli]